MLSFLRGRPREAADPTTLGIFGPRRVRWEVMGKREREGRGEEKRGRHLFQRGWGQIESR